MQEARRYPMRTLFYLSESQLERKLFFPRSHGTPRVDDRGSQRHHLRHQARTSVEGCS